MTIIRELNENIRRIDLQTSESIIDDISAYFDRQDDHTTIRTAIKNRYGVGVKAVQDPSGKGGKVTEQYVKGAFVDEVDGGQTEAISIGFGAKIANAKATMFTEPGQRFNLTAGEDVDTTDAQELLNQHRKVGGYAMTLPEADRKSIYLGSCGVLVSFAGKSLVYQKKIPSEIRFYFGDHVIEDGVTRSVNRADIEDASAVVFRLSQSAIDEYNYLAIIGRCEKYPDGRYVEYKSSSISFEIPDVGDQGAIDFYIGETLCNPLSYYANLNPELPVPDYPLAMIYGDVSDDTTPAPTSESLYIDEIEFSTGGSHLHSTSQEAARGLTVLSMSQEGKNHPLPRSLSGAIATNPGQEAEFVSKGAGESKTSAETMNMLMVTCAAGHSVPDYMVISEDYALEASSGIALEVKTRPLIKDRQHRIRKNTPSVNRLFDIEKYLIDLFDDEADAAAVALLQKCEQEWVAGEFELPVNKKERADMIISLLDKGLYDTIAALRELYHLADDNEAMELYDKMKARAAQYPPLAQDEKKTVGLLRNRRQQDNGQ